MSEKLKTFNPCMCNMVITIHTHVKITGTKSEIVAFKLKGFFLG